MPRAKSFSNFFNWCSKGSSWVFHGYFKFMGILGAKAPLGPKDVKVKMKAKKLGNNKILPMLLEDG